MSLRASKLEGISADDNISMTELVQKKKNIEIEKSIQENSPDNQQQLETDIAGSNDLWGS